MSDCKGAALMIDELPPAKQLLGDKGYDSDEFRKALIQRGILPCIPHRSNRKTKHNYDRELYKKRHKIENMFGKLKDCGASIPDMTDALTPSSQAFALQLPFYSGSQINES